MSDDQMTTVRKIMTSVRTCMLTTTSETGSLHGAPMTTQEAEYDGDSWFIAGRSSETVTNLMASPQVNLGYSDASSWLSLSGTASMVEDDAKKEELWNTFTEAWFPDGKDDPDVCVVKVVGDSAQYWESPGRVVTMASMLKARVTGSTPDAGDSATVDIADHPAAP